MQNRKIFKIKKKIINPNSQTFIISEIGINHEGNFQKCLKMIEQSKLSGADAIKLQTINPDLSYVKNSKSYNEFKNSNFTDEELFKIVNFTKKKGLIFISTPGSFEEVDKLEKFKSDAIKISSGLMTNYPLITYAAKKFKSVIISTGMAYISEIKYAISSCKKNKNIAILKCTSLYPASDNEINLNSIESFQKNFKNIIGFSDHTKDDLSCLAAVSKGAKIIEKHFTLDSKKKGKDHHISLEPENFKKMVNKIRRIEHMFGNHSIYPERKEITNRKFFHRYILAKKDINKGEIFTINNLSIKRQIVSKITDLKPMYLKKIIGLRSKRQIKKDEALKIKDLK